MYKHLIWFSIYIYMLNWREFAYHGDLKDLHLSASYFQNAFQIHGQSWHLTSINEAQSKKIKQEPLLLPAGSVLTHINKSGELADNETWFEKKVGVVKFILLFNIWKFTVNSFTNNNQPSWKYVC